MTLSCVARKIQVNGIVQGVGFRPFVYQLAGAHGLHGHVANTAAGVSLLVEGPAERIDTFIQALQDKQTKDYNQ